MILTTLLFLNFVLSPPVILNSSWYGPGFHGRKTANGEMFNQNAMTAAHKYLPFNTKLKVCRENKQLKTVCIVVRVNDRGPYIKGRDLDLSKAAAHKLGIHGVSPVYVTEIHCPKNFDLCADILKETVYVQEAKK